MSGEVSSRARGGGARSASERWRRPAVAGAHRPQVVDAVRAAISTRRSWSAAAAGKSSRKRCCTAFTTAGGSVPAAAPARAGRRAAPPRAKSHTFCSGRYSARRRSRAAVCCLGEISRLTSARLPVAARTTRESCTTSRRVTSGTRTSRRAGLRRAPGVLGADRHVDVARRVGRRCRRGEVSPTRSAVGCTRSTRGRTVYGRWRRRPRGRLGAPTTAPVAARRPVGEQRHGEAQLAGQHLDPFTGWPAKSTTRPCVAWISLLLSSSRSPAWHRRRRADGLPHGAGGLEHVRQPEEEDARATRASRPPRMSSGAKRAAGQGGGSSAAASARARPRRAGAVPRRRLHGRRRVCACAGPAGWRYHPSGAASSRRRRAHCRSRGCRREAHLLEQALEGPRSAAPWSGERLLSAAPPAVRQLDAAHHPLAVDEGAVGRPRSST